MLDRRHVEVQIDYERGDATKWDIDIEEVSPADGL